MSFVIGQRWISHADPQLGLGIVTATDTRRVTIMFPAVGEERTYAAANAPLSRITFRAGDTIKLHNGSQLRVSAVTEQRGLLLYTGLNDDGREQTVGEPLLGAQVQLSTPQQRLGAGQVDPLAAFQLRVATLQQLDRLQRAPVAGLLGARLALLPHQIHVASEVSGRFAPRVLLADEVGLGKTIEAGLILHRQLYTGLAARALIVVPETLLHQWLVEMLRRFNIAFALFDEARFQSLKDEGIDNPFETEQRVLCSLDWLLDNDAAHQCAVAAGWDLLIVDEAHHLHWSEVGASKDYLCVEQLATVSTGVLLLTATPEQAGLDSHFARLRLLDPARFHDIDAFRDEMRRYAEVNRIAQQLLIDNPDDTIVARVRSELGLSDNADRNAILRALLDRHGTSRVLLRNTRAAVAGFPERHLHPHPLPLPSIYDATALHPERGMKEVQWLREDPRVSWLEALLKQLKPAKVLVICADADTALALEHQLHLRAGIRCAAFHEGLTLLERDRAAAWFAEQELGAQALICSEIGSEGRNFQFASHLVLFDLPLNPDLLEQRIGRLDRIGQGPRIDIHVPFFEGSAQQVLFRWYDEGLDLFRRTFAASYALFEEFEEALREHLNNPAQPVETLVAATRARCDAMRQALAEGRDALLELGSCDRPRAEALITQIKAEEQGDALQRYMSQLWDYFGIDREELTATSLVVRPSDHMLIPDFPELPEDGTSVSFARDEALVREDLAFLSWEHPLVTAAMDLVAHGEHGNACVAGISIKGLKPGTLLLEAIFAIHCPAPKGLQLSRFLSLSPQRLLVDLNGKNLSEVLPHERLNTLCQPLPRNAAQAALRQLSSELDQLVGHAQKLAQPLLAPRVDAAKMALQKMWTEEAERLRALQAVNPTIRDDEIAFCERQLRDGLEALADAQLQLEALRLVINT
jgi:ATP-dependent helicase HepA